MISQAAPTCRRRVGAHFFWAVPAFRQCGATTRFEFSRASFHRKFVNKPLHDAKPSAPATSIMVVGQLSGQNVLPKLGDCWCLDSFLL